MSFNANIPQATDKTLQSFSQIRSNFQAINTAFAKNHVALTEDDQTTGLHNVVNMIAQGGAPVTSATQTAIYNQLVSSIATLFFAPNNAQTPIQLSYPSIDTTPSSANYSFVAGPFIVYFGFFIGITTGTNKTLSPGSGLLYVDLTPAYAGPIIFPAYAYPTNVSSASTTFTVNFTNSASTIYYFAIGKP